MSTLSVTPPAGQPTGGAPVTGSTMVHEESWLAPTALDRERVVDMSGRVARARHVQGFSLGGCAAVASPWLGWWLLLTVAAAAGVLLGLERGADQRRRPEIASACSIALLELVLTAASAGTGGLASPMLPWLIVPTVMLAARFPTSVLRVGVLATVGCALAAAAISRALPDPPLAPHWLSGLCWLALLASLIAAVTALLSAELQSRSAAAIDPLTGLANRLALRSRFAQAAEQARVLDAWVSVVMCDLDNFKVVNDTYGHDTGDHVLRAVAYELRRELRSFDSVYRLGGEEFVVLLPGVTPDEAVVIADRLRCGLLERPPAGLPVTLSGGVAGAYGGHVVPDEMLHAADQALYRAKRGGRNRIVVSDGTPAGSPSAG